MRIDSVALDLPEDCVQNFSGVISGAIGPAGLNPFEVSVMGLGEAQG